MHAVDLATGIEFGNLPDDFLNALRSDVAVKRGGLPEVAEAGPLDQVVAYVTGRPHRLTSPDGTPAPPLPGSDPHWGGRDRLGRIEVLQAHLPACDQPVLGIAGLDDPYLLGPTAMQGRCGR